MSRLRRLRQEAVRKTRAGGTDEANRWEARFRAHPPAQCRLSDSAPAGGHDNWRFNQMLDSNRALHHRHVLVFAIAALLFFMRRLRGAVD